MSKIYKLLNSLEGIYFSIHFMSNMSKEHEIRVKIKFKENKFRRSGGWNDFFYWFIGTGNVFFVTSYI